MRCQLPKIVLISLCILSVSGAVAFDNQTARSPAVLAPGPGGICSQHQGPGEASDPSTTSALPHHERYVAGARFKENISSDAQVRISWLGATFTRRFGDKTEEDANEATFQTHTVIRSSGDREIIAELDDRHETKLADVWCLLTRQPNGEDGTLQTNGAPNVFFVRDARGDLGAVDAVWGGAGWEIGASQVEGQRQWPSGSRVISR
jgi:hypothetical protein